MLDIGVFCTATLPLLLVGVTVVTLVLFAQVVLPPAVAYLITRHIYLPPYLVAGILLVAASPAALLSNVHTFLPGEPFPRAVALRPLVLAIGPGMNAATATAGPVVSRAITPFPRNSQATGIVSFDAEQT